MMAKLIVESTNKNYITKALYDIITAIEDEAAVSGTVTFEGNDPKRVVYWRLE